MSSSDSDFEPPNDKAKGMFSTFMLNSSASPSFSHHPHPHHQSHSNSHTPTPSGQRRPGRPPAQQNVFHWVSSGPAGSKSSRSKGDDDEDDDEYRPNTNTALSSKRRHNNKSKHHDDDDDDGDDYNNNDDDDNYDEDDDDDDDDDDEDDAGNYDDEDDRRTVKKPRIMPPSASLQFQQSHQRPSTKGSSGSGRQAHFDNEGEDDDDDGQAELQKKRLLISKTAAPTVALGLKPNTAFFNEENEEEDDYKPAISARQEEEVELDEGDIEREKLKLLISQFTSEQLERYECFKRSNLPKNLVKKVMQQIVVGQNFTPQSIIAVAGVTKVFVGEIIEEARDVMLERNEGEKIQPTHIREAVRRLQRKGVVPINTGKPRIFRR